MTTNKLEEYVFRVFEELHNMPEVGYDEYKTSAFIANELKEMGYTVLDKINGTGVIGILDSKNPGPIFALRADMDALEFEKDGEKYNLHACGHDANASMVLGAAKQIIETGISTGKIYVVFQPAEEKLGGSKSIIESGHINEVEEMVGIHLRPIQEAKLGEATPALIHGSSKRVDITVKGLNSHGARPHLGVNAVDAGVAITNAINSIKANPAVSYSVKVTSFKAGGEVFNIIPDRAVLTVDIRAQTNEVMDDIRTKLDYAIENGAKTVGAQSQIDFEGGVPAAEHNEDLIQLADEVIKEELGKSLDPMLTPGAEDFHFYSQDLGIKTTYIGLGADLKPGLHHPDMSFDKSALIKGCNILVKMTKKRLED
ncbi:amidohydrolase [Natranaerobius thermophilus]|uniref:Amidohydrolase n=1 Tax=Natranaerobius thermophilus (strain ATCC BAA-1301 / DSM 18059 / JW/NM-WN-LF) TaxID=457570 RepID=B2A7R6_NATTJ|nr:amidohydrolase [Natranaerobius thermophilus]ACB84368.1 amidohydrolase [Natranaerobius thermophilus JW/NM-WN-LF]